MDSESGRAVEFSCLSMLSQRTANNILTGFLTTGRSAVSCKRQWIHSSVPCRWTRMPPLAAEKIVDLSEVIRAFERIDLVRLRNAACSQRLSARQIAAAKKHDKEFKSG
jgi:hypothetical protein